MNFGRRSRNLQLVSSRTAKNILPDRWKTSLLVHAVWSLLSILGFYSVFFFGLLFPLGQGLSSLIDARFISSAAFHLTIFLAAVLSISRFAAVALPPLGQLKRVRSPFGGVIERGHSIRLKIARSILVVLGFFVFLLALFANFRFYLTTEAILGFLFMEIVLGALYLSAKTLSKLIFVEIDPTPRSEEVIGEKSRRVWYLIARTPTFVAFSLVSAFSLGIAKHYSLSEVSHQCVHTKDSEFVGAIFGETESGYLISIKKKAFFTIEPFSVRDGLPGIIFVPKSEVIRLGSTCSNFRS